MSTLVRRIDGWVSASRPAWLWLGQLGIVALGAHLAADRLDDVLVGLIGRHPLPFVSHGEATTAVVFAALALEVLVVARAAWILVTSAGAPELDGQAWWRKRSVESLVRPLFWGVMALAGAWSILLAIEDAIGIPAVATAFGAVVGGFAAWRLGWSGWRKVTAGLFLPKTPADGLLWAPLLLGCTALGLAQLPIWGWTS